MVKFGVDTSPVLNPPLATPDLMPSAANGAKNFKKCRPFK